MSLTVSERLAEYIRGVRLSDIDPAAIAIAKHVIAYHVGHALHGIRHSETDCLQAIAVIRDLNGDCGSSSIIGLPYKANAADAAFVNCTLMRAFGRDDFILPAGIHPGLMTLPVALTLAERLRSSGAELLTAIVVGYELLGKFGRWSWSLDMPRRATMNFGAFGGLAVAARLLGLTLDQTAVALAHAAHMAMGVAEGEAGPITHFYSVVCRNAVLGAYLSKTGSWASPTTLEGQFGFFQTFLGKQPVDADALMASLGHDYVILHSCEKRYPGTGLNHVPIELLRALIKEQQLTARDVSEIHIDFPVERRNLTSSYRTGPYHKQIRAKGSAAFLMAILLLDGDLDPARYEQFDDPQILDVTRRFHFEFVAGKPIRYTRLEVRTVDGRKFVREGDHFMHEREDNRAIMEREAAGLLSAKKIARFSELLENLEHVTDAGELMQCLVPDSGAPR